MLVLCSDGLTSDALLDELKSHIAGARRALLVVTADNEYKADNYHVPRCKSELEKLGLSVDIFDLDADDADDMLNYDVVEFIGGNPFYLLDSVRKNHAESAIKQIFEQKILIGWSAAVFVFGSTLELVNEYTPEMNICGLEDLSGLGLSPVEILPHYSKFISRFERFEEKCKAFELRNQTEVIRLNDGDGVIIKRDEVKIIRA